MKIEELQIEISINNEEEIKSKLTSIKRNIEEITRAAKDLNNTLDEINTVHDYWIKCSEQMPEKNTMVIVACYGSDIVIPQDGETVWQTWQRQNKDIKRVTLGFIDDDGYWNGADYMPMMISPTYWQPLFEAPDYEADPDDADTGLTWSEIFSKVWGDDGEKGAKR